MENSNFLSDEEWNANINKSAQELYDLLTGAYSDYYYSSHSFSADGTSDTYPLPDDFYKLLGVDQVLSADQSLDIKPYNFQERNSYIRMSSASSITLHYIPVMPKLERNTDVFDGVNGWEEYIIVDAAIKAMSKEESDVSELLLAKKDLKERLQAMVPSRDSNRPERVTDVHGSGSFGFGLVQDRLFYRIIGDNIRFVQGSPLVAVQP